MTLAHAANVIEPDFFARLRDRKNPYKTDKAEAARGDARKRLPLEYIHRAISVIGDSAPNHNILTLAHALAYADAGLHVIDAHALDRAGVGTGPGKQIKLPRGARWQDRATTDPSEIESFWTGDGEYPEDEHGEAYRYARPNVFRNVSAAFPKDCGLFVLDIDGDAGLDALEALEQAYGELPQTWESITGSGGVHLIFRAPDLDIRNTASSIAPGVDIRGANGQIIVPPSVHPSGNFYRWDAGSAPWECPVADAPDWLCKLAYEATKGRSEQKTKAKKASKKTKNGERASARADQSSNDAHGVDAHLALIGDGEGQKGFNAPIYSALCSYFGTHGADAPFEPILDMVQDAVADAERDPDRDRSKYDDEDYLWEQAEKAQEYVSGQRADVDPISEHSTSAIKAALADAGIDNEASEDDVIEFIRRCIAGEADQMARGRIAAEISKVTPLTKPLVNQHWQTLLNEDGARQRASVPQDGMPVVVLSGAYPDECAQIADIIADQGEEPEIFHSNERLVTVEKDQSGNLHIREIYKDRYRALLEGRIEFRKLRQNDWVSVNVPDAHANNVFHRDKTAYPKLIQVTGTPRFAEDMSRIDQPGYHDSGIIYQPKDAVRQMKPVSDAPTREEALESRDFVVDLIADFCLDGKNRSELTKAIANGEPVPSLCTALSGPITALTRSFIKGPTPGHFLRKDKPRTGATLLAGVLHYMGTLEHLPPQTLPNDPDEIRKTNTANLDSGKSGVLYDNLSSNTDSGEVAAMITAYPDYTGRRLQKTEMVLAANTAVYYFTGNRTAMSEELGPRMRLAVLDPKMEHPGQRPLDSFEHPDIRKQLEDNAAEYLHALLTIVQYWISLGAKTVTPEVADGFEAHSSVIGGILASVGLFGLNGNRETLTQTSNIDGPEENLMDELIEAHLSAPKSCSGTLFRVWSDEAPPQTEGTGEDRKMHKLAKHRVLSIRSILMQEGIVFNKIGYTNADDGSVFYGDRSRGALGQRIAAMAADQNGVGGAVRQWDETKTEEKAQKGRYNLVRVDKDRYSNLYQIKKLD